jgi:hypothetical protein
MNETQKTTIVVRAFFRTSGKLYRQFHAYESTSAHDVETLIRRAKGVANLLKRFYSVSQSMVPSLDTFLEEKHEWNFHTFFYQVGIVSGENHVVPDGFLLSCRSKLNGDTFKFIASGRTDYLSKLQKIFTTSRVRQYEAIFLGDVLRPELLELFEDVSSIDTGLHFFELTPFLLTHATFYKINHGIVLQLNS